jgi:VCBS repeat-containing protein
MAAPRPDIEFITSRNDHPMGLSCQRQQKARKGLWGALLAAMRRHMRSIRRASVAASRKESCCTSIGELVRGPVRRAAPGALSPGLAAQHDRRQPADRDLNPRGRTEIALLNGPTVPSRFLLTLPRHVLVEDGNGGSTTQRVSLTVTPVKDAARITGTIDGAVAEDGALVAGGMLTVEDADAGEARFAVPASLAGAFGSLTFDGATGAWGYTLDNAAAAVQALPAGESRTDTLSVASLDGRASEVITVNIAGADDGPRIEAAAFRPGPSSRIGSVSLVSGTADGVAGNGQSFGGVVSPDGSRTCAGIEPACNLQRNARDHSGYRFAAMGG